MQTTSTSTPRLMLALRIAAAVFGGYVLCWGFIALSTAGLYAAGSAFHDAEHLASILAFLIYPGAFCWAFCTRAPVRTALLLVGGGAAMTVVASLLQSHLVG